MSKLFYILTLLCIFSCTDNHYISESENIPEITYTVEYRKPNHNDITKQTKGQFIEKKETIGIIKDNDTIAVIEISDPSTVTIADIDYPWGWYQFPTIDINNQGNVVVQWQMKNDSAEEYGNSPTGNNIKISYDDGDTWHTSTEPIVYGSNEMVHLSNGDIVKISKLSSEDVTEYPNCPKPEFTYGNNTFYYESDLPDKFQGVYIDYFHENIKNTYHAKVKNDNLLRSATNGKIATFWYGKLVLKNDDLYAGIYPSYYVDKEGNLNPMAVSFYKSADLGRSWSLQGVINYQVNEEYHPIADFNNKGFAEPTFEFLNDGSIICIMRTTLGGVNTPMYKSYSTNDGISWTRPEPITPNGVMPQLIRLKGDILVLASGRPGIQLRFSCDGKGEMWSSPLELIDYDENKINDDYTCGYPFLYKASDNEVYIVYSNFKETNENGEPRKSILFRKIKVIYTNTRM